MNRSVVRKRWMWLVLAAGALMLTGCPKKPEETTPPPVVQSSEEKGKDIRLLPGASSTVPGYVDKEKEKASRSHDKHNHVRWINETTVPQAIKFTRSHWIFMEDYKDSVLVPPGARTEWFTIREDADLMEHNYTVTPLLSGPPGEPSITADP